MRRGSIGSLLVIGTVAGGVAAAVALGVTWIPTPASKEAERISFLFWFVIVICIVIFALVAAALTYAILNFRAAPDDESDGPPIHGHTGLEIWWTLIPTVLVTAIGIVSAIILARNDAAGSNPLRVDVTAQQFAWTFTYPSANNLTSGTLRLPQGRSVILHFTAKDVIHSFWVPEFSQKQDAVPGLDTQVHITPTRLGTFDVICTELCGLGHATMRTSAVVMTPAAFDRWLKGQRQATSSPNAAVAGAAVFENNACGSCHTFRPAGATGKVGPDLDRLAADSTKAGQPLAAYVRQSIEDPNAYVVPGYPKNVMPPFKLPANQLDALVKYLTTKG